MKKKLLFMALLAMLSLETYAQELTPLMISRNATGKFLTLLCKFL
jgi:hypothetical protein